VQAIWPPEPFKTREGYLSHQFGELFKFWTRTGRVGDITKDIQAIQQAFRSRRPQSIKKINTHLLRIGLTSSAMKDMLAEAFMIKEFGVFNAYCLSQFFASLKETGFRRFFPVRFLCVDIDDLKGLNDLCGNNYKEANRVIGHSMDILHSVVRTHRRHKDDRRKFPDLVFQVERGDEMVVVLSRLKTIAQAEAIGRCYQDALAHAPRIAVRSHTGEAVLVKAQVTCAVREMLDPQDDYQRILMDAFEAIHQQKAIKKGVHRLAA